MGLSLPVIQQEVQQIRNHHYLGCDHVQPPSFRDLQLAAQGRWCIAYWISLTGMTLEEADLRYLTGVSLIAMSWGEEVSNNPARVIAC